MARTAPGDIKAQLPARPPEQSGGVRRHPAPTSKRSSCRASRTGSIRGSSATSRPTALLASVLGDYAQHRPRRARAGLAVEPGAHRARRGRDRLDAPDGRPVATRGAACIQDTASTSTLVALLCARERATDYGLAAAACRPKPRRWSSTCRRTATARSRRRRCSPASAARTCASSPHDDAFAMRPDALEAAIAADVAAGRRRAPSSRRPARRRPPRSIPSARSPRSRTHTACGCTSTRRWPARR